VGLECGPVQAREAEECPVVVTLDGPQAEAVLRPVGDDPIDERVAAGAVQRRRQVARDLRVRVHGGEWIAIRLAPPSEQQACRGHGRDAHLRIVR